MTTNLLLKMRIFLLLFLGSIGFISAQTETIYIDFGYGSTSSASPWNNITNNTPGTVTSLINTSTVETGIGLKVTDGFEGINGTGTTSPNGSLGYPSNATSDSFFGSTSDTASLLLSNLVVGKSYTIDFFGSRVGVADNRETAFEVVAETTQTVSVDTAENTSNVATLTFKPKADGTAVINVAKGPNNTNSSGFFYLGAIELEYATEAPTFSNNALLVDFGINTNTSAANWNNLTDPLATGSLSNLVNNGGTTTNISLAVTDAFNYINEFGTTKAGQSLGIPATATADSFFGNTTEFEGKTETSGAIAYSNFDPDTDLTLTIYASRVNYEDTDNREAQYTIEGLTTETVYLDAENNTNNFVTTTVKPKADGTLTITVSKGPNNNNPNGFFYLGAMVVEYDSTPSITVSNPNGGEFWQQGKITKITWDSSNIFANVDLEYSTDNGANWNAIASITNNTTNTYNWTVPSAVSENCLVRATTNSVNDISDAVFEISDDETICNIVVLGSSTAEGIGASSTDKAWVNLYADAIYQNNTKLNVINLGKGGYTTYHVLPTGSSIPSGVTATVDTERNITKALSHDPIAIIVNLPSNDTAEGYAVADQLSNYSTIYNQAASNSVPMWIATSQPRNFSAPADIQKQIDVKDGILSAYGTKTINFWTNIAETDGTILASLNSGDGVHLNDAGHALLFDKVLATDIDDLECEDDTTLDVAELDVTDTSFQTYPNPVKDNLNIRFTTLDNGTFTLQLYDVLGRNILSTSAKFSKGDNVFTYSLSELTPQILVGKIVFKKANGEVSQKQLKLIIE
ncbi:lysophospholipase L1-like esterase [Wenyingzhuangia heitensis]|uniref:Lysophospholipase L1-like esterase n=1 Tax=Wenyingzhuangia heitensis TaxID=1487859 RepID=A0ABX0UEX3_9FLAO|nr:GDSL-type esterase/lipase family protein [Wenyingzhuangia heitensis]NIJ46420.1 lysophospholipase L1-like esterase [Wenyingzhuangia heitensis]